MRRLVAVLVAALAGGALALTPISAASAAHGPGPAAAPIALESDAQFNGYDVAIDSAGTAYVGWISYTNTVLRRVHLCVLPAGATACTGGVKTILPLGGPAGESSANGLQVVTGPGAGATLVWFHDTSDSINQPFGGQLATAVAGPDGSLSAATDRAAAPSFGSLKTATRSPSGQLMAVAQASTASPQSLYVYADFAAPGLVNAPFFVNQARLAYTGSTAVLAVDNYGKVSEPIAYSVLSGGAWSGFRTVANTWNVGAFGMTATPSGIRLVASVASASYKPAVAKFEGSTFGKAKPTGGKGSCTPSTHDVVSDGSGRVADVVVACSGVGIANLADTTHAGYTEFPSGGTIAGGNPQIATIGLGTGWVAWSIQSALGNQLKVVPVRLPATPQSKRNTTSFGKVTLTGVATCLPPVKAKVKLQASAKNGWHVAGRTLTLSGDKVGGKIDGAKLKPGKHYVLKGTVRFVRGGAHQTVTVSRGFRTCA